MKKIIIIAALYCICGNVFAQGNIDIQELIQMSTWYPGQIMNMASHNDWNVDTNTYKPDLQRKYVVLSHTPAAKLHMLYNEDGMELWYDNPDPRLYYKALEELQNWGYVKSDESSNSKWSIEIYENKINFGMVTIYAYYTLDHTIFNFSYTVVISPHNEFH